ncbi:hypothetical protein PsorP6_002819 [Peronosclerospora sorghi]|uniref:Uncharacterized protein n=1 Tax=Peronosclerospora sorghi TaxID=230839 RepID=A0ACC0VL77_9STRA|nr:hypothetical protein PsorP6_002819 [Peronosclerospora sorghi]
MTTQALEHGIMVTTMIRSKFLKTSNYDDLRRNFYRSYWLLTLVYILASALWIYLTDRLGARAVYGAMFCVLWWGVQLVLVIILTPCDEVIAKVKAMVR